MKGELKMIYVTGDCHGDWRRLCYSLLGAKTTVENDFIIVCGDFGIWCKTEQEMWELSRLACNPYTILFVDGNHENFDRLYSDEFEVVDYHGGKAHKICDNVYHLMRGYVFEFCGKTFFTFGGASSHDIQNGVLDVKDYDNEIELFKDYRARTHLGEMLRVNHYSWWRQELPTEDEMQLGLKNLKEHNFKVDYIITHCAPQQVVEKYICGDFHRDYLTMYFDEIMNKVEFTTWFFGHYHMEHNFDDKFQVLYTNYVKISS